MKYAELRNVLNQYSWKNTDHQTIFSDYLPRAYKLISVDRENLSEADQTKIDRHILHFFKPYCIVAKMQGWKIATLFEKYKKFISKVSSSSHQVVTSFKSDAEIRELRMIQAMGGQEYYEKLFD